MTGAEPDGRTLTCRPVTTVTVVPGIAAQEAEVESSGRLHRWAGAALAKQSRPIGGSPSIWEKSQATRRGLIAHRRYRTSSTALQFPVHDPHLSPKPHMLTIRHIRSNPIPLRRFPSKILNDVLPGDSSFAGQNPVGQPQRSFSARLLALPLAPLCILARSQKG